MAETTRRVYEIDVKLSTEAANALRAIRQQLKDTEDAAAEARKKIKDSFGGDLGINVAGFGAVKAGIDAIGDALSSTLGRIKGIAEIQSSLERLRLGFATVTGGGLEGAGEQIEYVRKVTKEMGIEFQSAAQAFLKLTASARGTNLEGKATRDIFEGVSLASRNLGLTTGQTENAFRALEQMISKGVVQQEELRGQLSEALPGAVQIAARAIGKTTDELGKLIKEGELFSDDFIPKFAAQLKKELGGQTAAGVNDATVALNTFKSSYEQLQQSITDAGLGKTAAAELNGLTAILDDITKAFTRAKKEGDGFLETSLRAVGNFGGEAKLRELQGQLVNVQLNPNNFMQNETRRAAAEADLKNEIKLLQDKLGITKEIQKEQDAAKPPAPLTQLRQFDNTQERIQTDQARRSLEKLETKYKDLNKERELEIKLLNQIRDAGKFAEDPKEYDRLYDAIVKKNTAKSDEEKLEIRAAKAADAFIKSLKAQNEAIQVRLLTDDNTVKASKNIAEADKLAIDLSDKKRKSFLAEVEALNEIQKSLIKDEQIKKAVAAADKESLTTLEKRTKSLREQAEADTLAAAIYGNEKEATIQLTQAKNAAALAEIELQIQEARRDHESPVIIAHLEDLAAAYREAADAKQLLLDKQFNDAATREVEEADRREREGIAKRKKELQDTLINNIKSNNDIGKGLVQTIEDELKNKVLEVAVKPLTEPFVDALNKAINQVVSYMVDAIRAAQAGSGAGNILGGLFSSGSGTPSGPQLDLNDTGGYFADGGIMTNMGPVPLRKYRAGGVARTPQAAIYGEGDTPEAYVPLPDGRTIPVTVKGGGGGTVVNVHNYSGEKTETRERQTDKGTEIDVLIGMVKNRVAEDISKGGTIARSMESQYGLNRANGVPR